MIKYKNPASNKKWAHWNLQHRRGNKVYEQSIVHNNGKVETLLTLFETDGVYMCVVEQKTIYTDRKPMLHQK